MKTMNSNIKNYKQTLMLHLFAVLILVLTTVIVLLIKKEKSFPVLITGAVIAWVLVMIQLLQMYF